MQRRHLSLADYWPPFTNHPSDILHTASPFAEAMLQRRLPDSSQADKHGFVVALPPKNGLRCLRSIPSS